jgi:phosphoglycolate phosphatase
MHLLFDLDGTLTDPFPGITRSIQYALESLGRPSPSADDLRWCIGPPLKKSFLVLLGPGSENLIDSAIAKYRERFGTVGLFENDVYPGITEALGALREKGHTLHVATSKPLVYAARIIDHFGLSAHFRSIHGSEMDGTRSDKASLLSHLLANEGLSPADALMIGDREHDMIGAVRNQIPGVGVLWGYGTRDELEAAGASRCINLPRELAGIAAR